MGSSPWSAHSSFSQAPGRQRREHRGRTLSTKEAVYKVHSCRHTAKAQALRVGCADGRGGEVQEPPGVSPGHPSQMGLMNWRKEREGRCPETSRASLILPHMTTYLHLPSMLLSREEAGLCSWRCWKGRTWLLEKWSRRFCTQQGMSAPGAERPGVSLTCPVEDICDLFALHPKGGL